MTRHFGYVPQFLFKLLHIWYRKKTFVFHSVVYGVSIQGQLSLNQLDIQRKLFSTFTDTRSRNFACCSTVSTRVIC